MEIITAHQFENKKYKKLKLQTTAISAISTNVAKMVIAS
jgi:hypothetical protein